MIEQENMTNVPYAGMERREPVFVRWPGLTLVVIMTTLAAMALFAGASFGSVAPLASFGYVAIGIGKLLHAFAERRRHSTSPTHHHRASSTASHTRRLAKSVESESRASPGSLSHERVTQPRRVTSKYFGPWGCFVWILIFFASPAIYATKEYLFDSGENISHDGSGNPIY